MPSLMREKLLIGLDDKQLEEINKSEQEFLRAIQEKDPNKRVENLTKFQKHPNHVRNLHYKLVDEANKAFIKKYARREFSIRVPIENFKSNGLIQCEGSIGFDKFKCLVTCGHWSHLRLKPDECKTNQINLLEHLSELVPSQGRKIGLFTFQNGINNSFEDFTKMGQSILRNLPEKPPLCIGLYNPTKGLVGDLFGVLDKLIGRLSDSICITHAMFTAIAEKLDKINDALMWAHIAHSEGGLIAESALTILKSTKLRAYFTSHLLIGTYGSVLPIPNAFAKKAINTYSMRDGATLPRVQDFLSNLGEKAKDYEISIVDSSEKSEYSHLFFGLSGLGFKAAYDYGVGDHGFLGNTYQRALRLNIEEFKRSYVIYDGK